MAELENKEQVIKSEFMIMYLVMEVTQKIVH